jgi:hypothetical protein
VKTWCIPPKANADFVWHMEDVLQTYQLPYDRRIPVVCMDEASKQLIGEVEEPCPFSRANRSARITNTSAKECATSSSVANRCAAGGT